MFPKPAPCYIVTGKRSNLPESLVSTDTHSNLLTPVPISAEEIGGEKDIPAASGPSVFVFPTTPAQRRFWLLDQLIPGGNPALNMPIGLHWHGPLKPPILQRALNQVVARHEALRTTLEPGRRQLQQLIAPTLMIDLSMDEWPCPLEVPPRKFMVDLMHLEACKPFDLRNGPLLRARVARIQPNDYLLLLTVHHIVSDNWSNRILLRDLLASYTALSQDKTPPLADLPFQFADYAEWLSTRLNNDEFTMQRVYWQTKLAGNFSNLPLPYDRFQDGSPTANAEVLSLLLPPELVRAAKSFGAAEGASPFMVFLAAFQVLLRRYTSQIDFLVTSPSANRGLTEFDSVIGPFANPLLLRADLRDDPSFRELVGRVRTTTLEAFSNQDIPFESLLDEFHAGRLQVNFNYEVNWQPPMDSPADVTVELLPPISTGTVYELSASALEETEGLRFEIEYKTALFGANTIEQMLADYRTLLEGAIAEPAKSISAFPSPALKLAQPTNLESQQALSIRGQDHSQDKSMVTADPVQPYLGLQLQLIAIWEDVLSVRGIGIRDDFFQLGGNSLLAIRMLQRAETVCGKFISPAALFRHPTIEHLAGEIAREVIDESPTLLHVNDTGTRTPFFYLHGDLSGGGFYSLRLSRALGSDQPFYVLPPHDIRLLSDAPSIEEMASAHLAALRSVRPKGPYVIGGFCIGGVVAYELAHQIEASGESVEMLLMIDSALEDNVLRFLRRLADRVGNLLRWDDHAKVEHFGRWVLWRGRLQRWYGLDVQTQVRIIFHRLSNRIVRAYNALRPRRRGTRSVNGAESDAARGRTRDIPSAFLWAAACYNPQAYRGPVTLLLSDDVMRGSRDIVREWRKVASNVVLHPLIGSHLECITAHVDTLAQTIESCLASTKTKTVSWHSKFSALRRSPQSPVSDIQIWTARLDSLSLAEMKELEASLDSTERARAARFHFEPDRKQYIASRGLLRHLISNVLEKPTESLAFEYGAQGKPALTSAFSSERTLHFNVSHSAGWAMFALAWDREIGIDLESASRLTRSGNDLSRLASKVLSARELSVWQALPDPAIRGAAFLRAWTRKEAFAKATGRGLFDTLGSIEVALDAAAPQSSLTLRLPESQGAKDHSFVLYDLVAPEGFVAALAIAQTPEEDR